MLQIDLVLSVEEMLQSLHLRHLFPQVTLDAPHSIRINKPNTLLSEWCDRLKIPKFITEFYLQWFVSDPFFMTGEELADAINQPVSSLSSLLSYSLLEALHGEIMYYFAGLSHFYPLNYVHHNT